MAKGWHGDRAGHRAAALKRGARIKGRVDRIFKNYASGPSPMQRRKLSAMRHGLKSLKKIREKVSIFKRGRYDNAVYKMHQKVMREVTKMNMNK